MRVMIRRLLEQQMVVVDASGSGMKDDVMWHVPQGDAPLTKFIITSDRYNRYQIGNKCQVSG